MIFGNWAEEVMTGRCGSVFQSWLGGLDGVPGGSLFYQARLISPTAEGEKNTKTVSHYFSASRTSIWASGNPLPKRKNSQRREGMALLWHGDSANLK